MTRLKSCLRSCLFIIVAFVAIVYVFVPKEVDGTPIPSELGMSEEKSFDSTAEAKAAEAKAAEAKAAEAKAEEAMIAENKAAEAKVAEAKAAEAKAAEAKAAEAKAAEAKAAEAKAAEAKAEEAKAAEAKAAEAKAAEAKAAEAKAAKAKAAEAKAAEAKAAEAKAAEAKAAEAKAAEAKAAEAKAAEAKAAEAKAAEAKAAEAKAAEAKAAEVKVQNIKTEARNRNPLDEQKFQDDGGPLQLRDIIHTVKTSKNLHRTRLERILLTWFKQAANQTYCITDGQDLEFSIRTNNHLIPSSCATDHSPNGLSCKMNLEFDTFVKHDGKWWCHWDDDNYVNLKALLPLLERYDWRQPWYLGRASVDYKLNFNYKGAHYQAAFAHGGCGFCVSRELARRMVPYAYDGKFLALSRATGSNDDCVIGYIINGLLKVDLTPIDEFNSHYHGKRLVSLTNEELPRQVSLSYGTNHHVNIRPPQKSFSVEQDPSRFYSIHCMNYPDLEYCQYLP